MRRKNARVAALVARIAIGIVLLPAGYAIAGLAGGAIPANRDWHEAAEGVVVFIESNGVHTGIVVPKVAAGVDWRGLAPARDLADPRYAAYDHLAFGWGERTFYLETPTWADVRPATVLTAAIGSRRTLIHVDHLPAPQVGPDIRRIVLRPAEYHRLAAYISGFVRPGGERLRGYGPADVFYGSTGRYSALATCNDWTGTALRSAGVRMGIWTPFPATVLWWLPQRPAAAASAGDQSRPAT